MIQTKNNKKKNKQNRLNCIFAFNKLFKSIWISSIYKVCELYTNSECFGSISTLVAPHHRCYASLRSEADAISSYRDSLRCSPPQLLRPRAREC